jgi:hypothetical protein
MGVKQFALQIIPQAGGFVKGFSKVFSEIYMEIKGNFCAKWMHPADG